MTPSTLHWRRKLHALLHDSPDKAVNIASHELRARLIKSLDGFEKAEFFDKAADWSASAADRIPFPDPRSSGLSEKLVDLKAFRHPLGGAALEKNWNFASEQEALEVSQKTRPFVLDTDDARAAFICAWRFWRNWASDSDPRFAFLPADTRIPDHTIWQHMGVTSAFQGAFATPEQKQAHPGEDLRPRLLLFSIGPVQDFIAAARSTRDLWSGSYLLSWLVATTLGTIAKDIGPDQVLFPNLLGQPLIDHQLCEGVFDSVSFSGAPISEGLGYASDVSKLRDLLTPSLPNRFLALLPARMPHDDSKLDEYVRHLVEDLNDALANIASSVSRFLTENPSPLLDFDPAAFEAQAAKLLEVHWQLLPVPANFTEIVGGPGALAELLPKDKDDYTPRQSLEAILKMTGECKPQYDLNATTGWGLLNAVISWLHDGSKSLRSFEGWREGRWQSGAKFNKDALNGKEEAVLRVTGSVREIEDFCTKTLGMSRKTFKPGELLGASTLIKRLWHETWLVQNDVLGVTARQIREAMPMPNTRSVAARRPFAQDSEGRDEIDGADLNDTKEKYFAILALDGDEMGKWISGARSPAMQHCLSPKAQAYYEKNAPDFLKAPRAVTPSWHLQFSEALGNFSLYAARRIVESFNGRLIYAGGDDVLAMLPATEALACARALRAAFRGEKEINDIAKGLIIGRGNDRQSDRDTQLFNVHYDGYLQLHPDSGAAFGDRSRLLSDPVNFPVLVPGPAADVSVGIAIAHFKAPLQDVVKAAQAAEKRAKRSKEEGGLGRAAVAISLFKRSGEILEWGTRWSDDTKKEDSAGYRLLHTLLDALGPKGKLNGRFPHKLEALLKVYLPGSTSIRTDPEFESSFPEVIRLELDHCLKRNAGGDLDESARQLFLAYWEETAGHAFEVRIKALIHLLRVAAWSRPSDPEDANKLQPA